MELTFYLPTKVIMGKGCVEKKSALFKNYGKKALIITYPLDENPALGDVTEALGLQGISYEVIMDSPVNPDIADMDRLAKKAARAEADMIVGIGGGSALDTAKTIAVLCTNDIEPMKLYENIFEKSPLPVITIPTTAGTGSEVTPYSVLSIKEKDTKKSFGNEDQMSPVLAFLDARYTESMPHRISADSAVDALSHGLEGFMRKNGTWVSDMLGLTIFKNFALCKKPLLSGDFDFNTRERLLYNACLSGIMINHARTLAVHAMGYELSLHRNLSHGCACGVLLGTFMEFVYPECSSKAERMYEALGVKDTSDFGQLISSILNYEGTYTTDEIKRYTQACYKAALAKPNPIKMDKQTIFEIYKKALIDKT